MTRFEWTVDRTGSHFALRGMVTSAGELTPMVTSAPAQATVFLDVGGIRAFTSSGVSGWIDFLQQLRDNGCHLVFERCSPAVVKQTQAIYDFLCGGAVRSIVVPYICPSCDAEAQDELAVTAVSRLPASRRCACGAEMELDDLPQLYQALLSDAGARC
jgi:hypothetical protein